MSLPENNLTQNTADLKRISKFPEGSYFSSAWTTLDIYDNWVSSLIRNDMLLLDIGCGKKSLMEKFTDKVSYSIGMDISHSALRENKTRFSLFVNGDAYNLPFKDESADIIVTQWMIEHIEKPEIVLAEFCRVLKAKGHLIVVTNSLYHPMMLLSAILPAGFRDRLKKKIFPSYIDEDTFPTYYNFNSLGRIHSMLSKAGFERNAACYSGAPFFFFNKVLFRFSELYERLTDISFLRFLKLHIIVHYVKREPGR